MGKKAEDRKRNKYKYVLLEADLKHVRTCTDGCKESGPKAGITVSMSNRKKIKICTCTD